MPSAPRIAEPAGPGLPSCATNLFKSCSSPKPIENDAILHHHHHDLQVAQGILGNIEHNITSSLCAIEYWIWSRYYSISCTAWGCSNEAQLEGHQPNPPSLAEFAIRQEHAPPRQPTRVTRQTAAAAARLGAWLSPAAGAACQWLGLGLIGAVRSRPRWYSDCHSDGLHKSRSMGSPTGRARRRRSSTTMDLLPPSRSVISSWFWLRTLDAARMLDSWCGTIWLIFISTRYLQIVIA